MSEPYWTVKTEEMMLGWGIVAIIVIAPLVPPLQIGFLIGERLSNLNGVRYVTAAIAALSWVVFLIWVYAKAGIWALLGILALEGLVTDAVYALIEHRTMHTYEVAHSFYTWFTKKV